MMFYILHPRRGAVDLIGPYETIGQANRDFYSPQRRQYRDLDSVINSQTLLGYHHAGLTTYNAIHPDDQRAADARAHRPTRHSVPKPSLDIATTKSGKRVDHSKLPNKD